MLQWVSQKKEDLPLKQSVMTFSQMLERPHVAGCEVITRWLHEAD